MSDTPLQRRLVTTPFVASWIGDARPGGDKTSADIGRRKAGWATWAVENLVELTGARERSYTAIALEGKFHDPRGTGPLTRPHLEIPQWVIDSPDPHFPHRLAMAGNGLAFPWWLMSEVTAVRRAIFNGRGGDPTDLFGTLEQHRPQLEAALATATDTAGRNWGTIEQLIMGSDDGLVADATGNFGAADINELLHGTNLSLTVTYDQKLLDISGSWASRRVGVWQIAATSPDGTAVKVGVCTPRLTANSQFRDPLFAPATESPAALLVRTLLLRRLARNHLGISTGALTPPKVAPAPPARTAAGHLRAVPAKVGARLPEASTESAVNFLHTHPDPHQAWAALTEWAIRTHTLLTVSEEGFTASHKRASRFLRRAEDPERDDVNVLLPLGWDDRQRVVRVTFSRPQTADN